MRQFQAYLIAAIVGATSSLAAQFELALAWSLPPESRPYLMGGYQHGIAYHAVSEHLLIVDRADYRLNNGSVNVFILNPRDGSEAGFMDVSAVEPGSWPENPLNMIAVAEDGVIYAANYFPSVVAEPKLNIYRWENEGAVCALVFSGDPDPGNRRGWGENLAVRGRGVETELLMVSSDGKAAARFIPAGSDQLRSELLSLSEPVAPPPSTPSRLGALCYEGEDGFWTAAHGGGGGLMRYRIARASRSAELVSSYFERATGSFNSRGPRYLALFGALARDVGTPLMAALSHQGARPSRVHLFDVSSESAEPVLLDSEEFPSNGGDQGSIQFGEVGDRKFLFALNDMSGLAGYEIKAVPDSAPVILAEPVASAVNFGDGETIDVLASGALPRQYQWFHNGSAISGAVGQTLGLSNFKPEDAGEYYVVVSNALGSVTSSPIVLGNTSTIWLSIAKSGNGVVVSWRADPGYVLEQSAELGAAPWSLVASQPVLSGDTMSVNLDSSLSRAYFRLRKIGFP